MAERSTTTQSDGSAHGAPPGSSASIDLVADGLMSVPAASVFFSVSRSKLYELMETGRLVYVKIGRSRRIPRRAAIELAARNLIGGWQCKR